MSTHLYISDVEMPIAEDTGKIVRIETCRLIHQILDGCLADTNR